jgi:hypothetical protein
MHRAGKVLRERDRGGEGESNIWQRADELASAHCPRHTSQHINGSLAASFLSLSLSPTSDPRPPFVPQIVGREKKLIARAVGAQLQDPPGGAVAVTQLRRAGRVAALAYNDNALRRVLEDQAKETEEFAEDMYHTTDTASNYYSKASADETALQLVILHRLQTKMLEVTHLKVDLFSLISVTGLPTPTRTLTYTFA